MAARAATGSSQRTKRQLAFDLIHCGSMYRAALLLILSVSLGLSGCGTLPNGKPDKRDRFERVNRSVYKFNVAVDHAVLRPAARAYVKVLPRPVRTSVSNFTSNLAYPVTMVNDFLQGKVADGVTDAARIVVNTTLGLGGLFDPASHMGLDRHDEDFGQTMGRWGVKSGPYVMLPFFGPSTVRDTFGMIPDYALTYEVISVNLITEDYISIPLFAIRQVDTRASLLDTDHVLDSTYDPYAFVRNAYLQRREYLIRDGDVPPEELFPDADTDSDPTDKPAGQTQK
jgi:phospholipid-binding lipoprotein MlaA